MATVKIKMYLNALKCAFPYDNVVLAKLINHGSSQWLSHVFHRANKSELQSLGVTSKQIDTLREARIKIDPEQEYARTIAEKITLISRSCDDYPTLLNEIHDAPEILYMQGQKSLLTTQMWGVSIVGTRTCSSYGITMTENIVRDLKMYSPTIVSGLAMGIDQVAHRAAVANALPTIAVLGAGHGSIKGKKHFRLIRELLANHLIISEYPFQTSGTKFTFPQRNRIISGLSLATIVIEAKERSGSLITAQLANDQKRDVFALPGSCFNEMSRGTNKLIQKGEATLFTDVPSMIEAINFRATLPFEEGLKKISHKPKCVIEDPIQEKVYNLLKTPTDFNTLLEKTRLSTQELLTVLSILELQGMVKESNHHMWIRIL